MKNGTAEIQHKLLGTKYTLKANSGSLRLYDINSGLFIRTINESYLKEFYDIKESTKPTEPKLYNIHWIVNGIVKERIPTNCSYAVCMHKISEMKRTSHKTGLLVPVYTHKT